MDHDDAMRLQEEMEPDFRNLADWWESRGHSSAHVAEALLALAVARVEMVASNGKTEVAIARAKATVGRVEAKLPT